MYESELERIGNVYMLRDEPPHRTYTLTAEAIMATGVYGFRWGSRGAGVVTGREGQGVAGEGEGEGEGQGEGVCTGMED